MSDCNKPPYTLIFEYLLQCTSITFRISKYVPNQSIPNLNLGRSTIQKLLSGKEMSQKTAEQIAYAFSLKLRHPETGIIFPEHLYMPLDEFKKIFPDTAFIRASSNSSSINRSLFTNKLYRGYYMVPNSPHSAYMSYFKLFEKNGIYRAYMVRGIKNPDDANRIESFFSENPEQLMQCIQDIHDNGNKSTESIHIYVAESDFSKNKQDITFTNKCIKIDFHSLDESPCCCTMFWNIHLFTQRNLQSYIGGTSLIVDTNDGKRGKNISAFKMGFEAIEGISDNQLQIVQKDPLCLNSIRVINEISLESEDGILTLDDSEDTHFYHFIQCKSFRYSAASKYENENTDDLVKSLFNLKKEYEQNLDSLKKYIKELKKDTK